MKNFLAKSSRTIIKNSKLSANEKLYFKNLLSEYVKKHGLRSTSQRDLILDVVLNSERHIDAETVTQIVKKTDPTLGIATVYRTLRMMTSAQLLVERYFDGARAQFEFVDFAGEHHDHIICLECKNIVEFFNEDLENLQNQIAKDLKFELKNHRMELFGVCAECQKLTQS